MMDLIQLVFGSGIIGLLFTISHDLGKLRGSFDAMAATVANHEHRITNLEAKGLKHEGLA
jgi:hypothetical protein